MKTQITGLIVAVMMMATVAVSGNYLSSCVAVRSAKNMTCGVSGGYKFTPKFGLRLLCANSPQTVHAGIDLSPLAYIYKLIKQH